MIYHGIRRDRVSEIITAASIFLLTYLAGSLGWWLGDRIADDDAEVVSIVCDCVRADDLVDVVE